MFSFTPRKHPRAFARATLSPAFTLIELLTVIAIIGILAALLIPVVGRVRNSARKSQCTSNLRQLGTAFQLYANDNRGLFPAARKNNNPTPQQNPTGGPWQDEISPYVTRTQNIGQIKRLDAFTSVQHCPSYDLLFTDKTVSSTIYNSAGYGMNVNIKLTTVATWDINLRFRLDTVKTPGRTVLVADSGDYHVGVGVSAGWSIVANDPDRPDGYNSGAPTRHAGSANYLFCDGHVETLAPDPALAALRL